MSSFIEDLQCPCYFRRDIVTKEISTETFILFVDPGCYMLVYVTKHAGELAFNVPFLKVNLLESKQCNVPEKKGGLFLCGIDTNVVNNFGVTQSVFMTSIKAGRGIMLCESAPRYGNAMGIFYCFERFYMLEKAKLQ